MAGQAAALEEGNDELDERRVLLVHARVAPQRLRQHPHHRRQRVLGQESFPHRLRLRKRGRRPGGVSSVWVLEGEWVGWGGLGGGGGGGVQ